MEVPRDERQQEARVLSGRTIARPTVRQALEIHPLLVGLAALIIIIGGMKLAADLVVPLLLAVFVAAVCDAPVRWLARHGIGQRFGVPIVILTVCVLFSSLAALLVSRFTAFSDEMPKLEESLRTHYQSFLEWLASNGLSIAPAHFSELIDPASLTQWVPNLLTGLGGLLSSSVIIVLTATFLLYEALSLRDKLVSTLRSPHVSLRRFTLFSLTLRRYLAVKTLISLITGALVGISCLVLGVEFAFLWATLAFCLNYIPNIGSALAAIPAVLLTLVMPEGGPVTALMLGGCYMAINFILGNMIEPRVMGRTLGLSTLAAFLSLVVWGWVFGPVGMLLSVPITMTLKIAFDSHPGTRWVSRLLGPSVRRIRRRQHMTE
ncbi:AI-2E family transporter [Cobetia crustatorum]|uniref:AI-2E family transporter n=2 Tax=Halomonadaceae TaxID=28256 RepID=A0A558HUZ4_9GAMM|nr:AI-2E family transporter [Cobetia crustatorum]